jgi:serine/threonine-protein kinase RIO1
MKQTSLKAFFGIKEFSENHKQRILKALEKREGHSKDIALRTGLTDIQVMRRLSELERRGKVVVFGTATVNGKAKGIYHLNNVETPQLSKAMYKRKQFENWKKQSKKFKSFLGEELYFRINEL